MRGGQRSIEEPVIWGQIPPKGELYVFMWYVIYVKNGHEEESAEILKRLVLKEGEDAFVMMAVRMFRVKKEWQEVKRAAFPNYVFVITEDTDDFRIRMKKMLPEARMLRVGDAVSPISKEEETMLTVLGGEEHCLWPVRCCQEGSRVRITEGPMAGRAGILKWVNVRQRIAGISLQLFGQETVVKIGIEVVREV